MNKNYSHKTQERHTVLLTLGRLPKCLDLARAFAAAGCRVLVAEPHKRTLTGLSRAVSANYTLPSPRSDPDAYEAALLQVVDQQAVDLVVPISEEALHVVPLLALRRPQLPVFAPTPELLLQLHDKLAFIRLVDDLGWPSPATCRADQPRARALTQSTATVLKARASCAGDGLEILRAGEPIPIAKGTTQWLLQERIDGALTCSFAVVTEGMLQDFAVYEAAIVSGTVAVCFRRIEDRDGHYQRFSTAVASATEFSGFLAFDFIDSGTGVPLPIECNPRVTSGIHFLDTQQAALHILSFCGLGSPHNATPAPLSLPHPHPLPLPLPLPLPHPEPTTAPAIAPLQQQFYPCLTETQSVMFSDFATFKARLRLLCAAKDVTFSWRDPLPFLLMPYAAWPIMAKALFGKMSFGAAATEDIEWDGQIES